VKSFNIRVYGLLLNELNQVLVSDEQRMGIEFTKFPGGGLEWGEGLKDCLVREFLEEVEIKIEVGELFYMTDFFQVSAFDPNEQIFSVYYVVDFTDWKTIPVTDKAFDLKGRQEVHRWVNLVEIDSDAFKFPIDKIVADKLKERTLMK